MVLPFQGPWPMNNYRAAVRYLKKRRINYRIFHGVSGYTVAVYGYEHTTCGLGIAEYKTEGETVEEATIKAAQKAFGKRFPR